VCEFAKTNSETTVTKEELSALIGEVGLGHIEEKLMQAARPSLRLHLHPVDESAIPIGGTKFGGAPDLPPGFEWPIWQGYPESDRLRYPPGEFRYEDGAQEFLAQLRLEDLAGYDLGGALRASGVLYLFCATWKRALGYDEEDRDCWRVFYYNGDLSKLTRRFPPSSGPGQNDSGYWVTEDTLLTCCRIDFQPEIVLPDRSGPEAYELLGLSVGDYGMSGGEGKSIMERYIDLFQSSEDDGPRKLAHFDGPIHRLLGYPQMVQWGTNAPGEDQNWRLLLQLDTEDMTGARWPDFVSVHWQGGGRGYFYIPAQALAEQNFDAVWVDMQCN